MTQAEIREGRHYRSRDGRIREVTKIRNIGDWPFVTFRSRREDEEGWPGSGGAYLNVFTDLSVADVTPEEAAP